MSERESGDVVGLVPAAGTASRLGPLPCSKEILPVWPGWEDAPGAGDEDVLPGPACLCLLQAMGAAGASRAFVVLRHGKWDIPAALGAGGGGSVAGGERSGSGSIPRLAYLVMTRPFGPPYTLDEAYPFVEGRVVLTGFPDILFSPRDAFVPLLERLRSTGADAVLGLVPARPGATADRVSVDGEGRVRRVEAHAGDPAPREERHRSWCLAAWTPGFTDFLHGRLQRRPEPEPGAPDLQIGRVVQAAIEAGLRVEGCEVSRDPFLDIGSPEGLREAYRRAAASAGS